MREKRFALSLGLPEDSTGDCARVTLVGQSAALVEGQHGVIELTESRVRLRTGRGVPLSALIRMIMPSRAATISLPFPSTPACSPSRACWQATTSVLPSYRAAAWDSPGTASASSAARR